MVDERSIKMVESTRPLPIDHVLRIYSIRAKVDEKKGNRIAGMSALVERLKASEEKEIVISAMEILSEPIAVFSDRNLKKIIQILMFPHHKSDQENHLKQIKLVKLTDN